MRTTTPTVLITGSPRSGTSFVATTLNSHREVSIFAKFSLTRIYQTIDRFFLAAGDQQFAPFNASAKAQFLRLTFSQHNEDFVTQLFTMVYPYKIARIVGSKTPAIASLEDVDYLLNRVPDLRTIYIVRNIADVIQSSMRRRDAAATSGESWILATEQEAIDEWLYSPVYVSLP